MTITYPLTPPSEPGFTAVKLRRRSITGFTASPYTGTQYVQSYPGQWWEADITLRRMRRTHIGDWRAFFAKLNGNEGTFLLGVDPEFAVPSGSAGVTPGTPLVKGALQSGNVLNIDGLPVSVSGYLLPGDFVQIGTGLSTRLYMNLDTVNSNGSGEASLLLWPSLRSSPADNAPLTVSACKGLFRMFGGSSEDSITPGTFFETGFSAIEALS